MAARRGRASQPTGGRFLRRAPRRAVRVRRRRRGAHHRVQRRGRRRSRDSRDRRIDRHDDRSIARRGHAAADGGPATRRGLLPGRLDRRLVRHRAARSDRTGRRARRRLPPRDGGRRRPNRRHHGCRCPIRPRQRAARCRSGGRTTRRADDRRVREVRDVRPCRRTGCDLRRPAVTGRRAFVPAGAPRPRQRHRAGVGSRLHQRRHRRRHSRRQHVRRSRRSTRSRLA